MSGSRSPYQLHRVAVERAELVTPHMKRVTIDGGCLEGFRPGLPAQWLKVFVPAADGGQAPGRAYTVRRFDPESRRLDLEFVLHGDNGPASAWVARVAEGDCFEISPTHPRSGLDVSGVQNLLLFGDETALPAIGGILEALPAGARAAAFIEIADAGERQQFETRAAVNITWLYRGAAEISDALPQAARAIPALPANSVVWVAAESGIVKTIRAHAATAWRVERKNLHAAGYWKRGEADHRDADGDA